MIQTKELSFLLLIVDQFVDHDTVVTATATATATANEQQSTNTDHLMNMMKLVSFNSMFNLPIYTVQQRDLAKIRRQLNLQKYILTSVYKTTTNMIYACKQNEINEKVTEYMKQTNAYKMMHEFDENNLNTVKIYLQQFLCQQMKKQLNILYNEQRINAIQYKLLNQNPSNVQLKQLSFKPDLRRYEIPFEPAMISYSGPTANMARYLYYLIAPIYYGQIAVHQTTFSQGNDAIQAIELYYRQGRLRSTTFFATIQIPHLSAILSHTHTMNILECFLKDSSLPNGSIQGITIETILELVNFVLTHQYFIYQNKFYQQIKGGYPLPLTRLLADIYLFYWQKQFVSFLNKDNEIFGRCFDQLFLTWNRSKIEFVNFINTIDHHHHSSTTIPPTLKLISTIGSTINYMDVTISHYNGVLQTKVFHPFLFESYSLQSTTSTTTTTTTMMDHRSPRDLYFAFIRAALLRAVQYCTHVHDFETESHFIRLSLLLNHFPANYIKECFELFENEFQLTRKSFCSCQHAYNQVRERIRTNFNQNGQTTYFIQENLHGSIDDHQGTNLTSSYQLNSCQCHLPSSKRIKLVHHG